MTTLFTVVFLIVLGAESLVGITANAFVVAVNLLSWTKDNVLIAHDQVLLMLGLANFCVQGTSAVVGFSFFFYKKLFHKGSASQVFWFFFVFSNSSSLWLTVILLSNYYMMMSWTRHPFFLRMKRIVTKNMPWILCYFFLLAFGSGLFVSSCHAIDVPHNVAVNFTSNSSEPVLHVCKSIQLQLVVVIIGFIWPFLITSFYITNILTDIWKHICSVKKTMASSGEPSLKAYRDATTTLTTVLVLHLFYTVSFIVVIFNVFSNSRIGYLVCATLFSILTSAQAVTLILGIPKLKKEARQIFQRFRSSTGAKHDKSTATISYVTPP